MINDWDPNCMVGDVPTLKCFESVFSNILSVASVFIILVLFIMFAIGSFSYLTSLGNPEKVKKAQGTLKFAVIGFILFTGSYLIMNIICYVAFGQVGSSCPLFKFELPGP
ncbi:hypothetical protein COS31_01330 [Candidatus Roizmanbacteria bacterium CG02_land_8_20_14_3_00_36_15]|uniref:Uncharacterized protein n=2 Tax=Candidatus Roizmaniibacteriota TaxID=1752723 RepID=A0A2M8KKG2_9BACT|nr:MAG: hypothetical protein COS51_00835 [Candidatus Roizmanbacteria bacterium CG03_land_8_20_14_0_80_36_21]PIV38089.1 MAG: hypothetical protein COS31_01330 [Candidatus Roizmanbacteria bacterium CG02_land_8_20_14_3_00_36_15]PIY70068.1 MAG: hypothetical protein COY89_03065 [Candidatus Roizmanbacteria bacterium CG_4_10_14_0_8_um_filter_36_36]PJA52683.1 MAG: hypothetical protein CO166_04735 [Candidatus Roizmanbacteria bacterium CG_4_9_14_3_um_filter_36_11]PJC82021.1 MAG: hypothetical protein CO007